MLPFVFGDFNIVTLADSKPRNDYEKLLYAFDFKRQNYQPTRVTATSSNHPLVWIILSQASKHKHRQSPQQLVITLVFYVKYLYQQME